MSSHDIWGYFPELLTLRGSLLVRVTRLDVWNLLAGVNTLWLFWAALSVLCARSHLTLCDPVNCSPPGSSVHRVFQAITLERIATSYSRGSSQPRDRTRSSCISCTGRWFFTTSTSWEALSEKLPLVKVHHSIWQKWTSVQGRMRTYLCGKSDCLDDYCVRIARNENEIKKNRNYIWKLEFV